jgi:hypothetical protein
MAVKTSKVNGPGGAYPQASGEAAVKANGGLVRIRCHVQGVTPLLMNAMSEEALLNIRDKVKPAKSAAKPSLRDEADSKVYRLADGRPCVPVKNLYASFIGAGQFIRLDGKRQITTAKATLLPGMLLIEDIHLPVFTPGTQESATWEVDIQQGRNPNGGEAVCIVRPRFDAWALYCTLEVDLAQMPLTMAYELVEKAGKRMGLGDGRPARRLTFGRYSIVRWDDAD